MKIVVVTSVFPNEKQPTLGVFVRERMFRVARHCELKVVAPVPWFPFASFLRKGYRPDVHRQEVQDGVEVLHPRFLSIPGLLKSLDGIFFGLSVFWTVFALRKRYPFDLIDAHFLYPDGVGAALLGSFLGVPVTITARESSVKRFLYSPLLRPQISWALQRAARVFSVCSKLKMEVCRFGIPEERVTVVPNGVDIGKFMPTGKAESRRMLGLPPDAPILLSVGWLIERKGFHRVIRVLPELRREFPNLIYVIVGGETPLENFRPALEDLVASMKLQGAVILAGSQPHEQLRHWLSAADLFCLASSGEGWANVFLEAMACGLPVVTSRVGGNEEAVPEGECGLLFSLEDEQEMVNKLREGIIHRWEREKIIAHAAASTWEHRIGLLLQEMRSVTGQND